MDNCANFEWNGKFMECFFLQIGGLWRQLGGYRKTDMTGKPPRYIIPRWKTLFKIIKNWEQNIRKSGQNAKERYFFARDCSKNSSYKRLFIKKNWIYGVAKCHHNDLRDILIIGAEVSFESVYCTCYANVAYLYMHGLAFYQNGGPTRPWSQNPQVCPTVFQLCFVYIITPLHVKGLLSDSGAGRAHFCAR